MIVNATIVGVSHIGVITMNEIKTFRATKFDEKEIQLTDSKFLKDLYKTIEKEENFLLLWKEGSVEKSRLIMGNDMIGKVKNGDIVLSSTTGGK